MILLNHMIFIHNIIAYSTHSIIRQLATVSSQLMVTSILSKSFSQYHRPNGKNMSRKFDSNRNYVTVAMNSPSDHEVNQLVKFLESKSKLVVLTGAGVSTGSGEALLFSNSYYALITDDMALSKLSFSTY